MEPTLGLGGGGGGGGVGLNTTEKNNGLYGSKDYMDMSKETELELGLGLSLGNGGGVGLKEKEKEKEKGVSAAAWGDYGRILTAKDFPNGFSANRPDLVSSGTKRERMSSDFVQQGGSNSAAVSQVVGWPPIKGYRMNTLFSQTKTSNVEDDKKVGGNEKKETSNKKINHGNDKTETTIKERGHLGYVKVNMDGLPIGRKVDLNALKNYDTLAKALEEMFFKPSLTLLGSSGGKEQSVKLPRLFDASSEFVLTYEDKEGDWMLVGDVPWGMFFNTVKRLRIMKTSEAKGLAPKFQERNDKQKGRPI